MCTVDHGPDFSVSFTDLDSRPLALTHAGLVRRVILLCFLVIHCEKIRSNLKKHL